MPVIAPWTANSTYYQLVDLRGGWFLSARTNRATRLSARALDESELMELILLEGDESARTTAAERILCSG